MAQFSTDFSEYTAGAAPPDWTALAGATLDILADAGSLSGQVMRIQHDAIRFAGASWGDVGTAADIEVVWLGKAPSVGAYLDGFGAFARQTGVDARTGYRAVYREELSSFASIASSGTTLGSIAPAYAIDGNTKIWARLRCNGTTISAWFWQDGDTPKTNADTPDITLTNADHTTGVVGVFSDVGETGTPYSDIEYFAAGTAGDAAPLPSGDTTPPVLSSPTGTATSDTTADGSVSTDEGNGTLSWVVTTSATAPSVAQVKAGQDHTGAAAAASGSQAVSATGVQSVSATGLAPSTAYYFHYQHADAAANDSTVSTSAQFTTDASQNAGIREIVYDSSDVILPDGSAVQWAAYADFAALRAGTVLTDGVATVSGGAGQIEIDSDLLGSVGGTCLLAVEFGGETWLKPAVTIIDLAA